MNNLNRYKIYIDNIVEAYKRGSLCDLIGYVENLYNALNR